MVFTDTDEPTLTASAAWRADMDEHLFRVSCFTEVMEKHHY